MQRCPICDTVLEPRPVAPCYDCGHAESELAEMAAGEHTYHEFRAFGRFTSHVDVYLKAVERGRELDRVRDSRIAFRDIVSLARDLIPQPESPNSNDVEANQQLRTPILGDYLR